MTGRGRNFNQSNEWDSMRDDYNSSIYDPQYPDDDASGGVNLDHCRLYIKNIPKGLNEEGLRAAFAKFGTLVEVFLSKDPQKNYGLVKYETPGEAKLAMMKMNRTEPLRLQINIAHKSKNRTTDNRQSRDWQERGNNGGRDRSDRNDRNDRLSLSNRDREESGSVVSRGRNSRVQEDTPNGDNNMDDLLIEDDYGFSDILDPNLHLELESLKLEQLKVREEQLQCKQRVILLKQAERRPMTQMSNRCILPDGKIVVRNINDRESRDADVSFSAGAGDSLKIPGLQRVAARQCVVCGSAADAYCAGCGITPYCSERCQRRDWVDRHSSVCHNLARTTETGRSTRDLLDNEPRMQPAVPLRRPHVSNGQNFKREPRSAHVDDKDDDFATLATKAGAKSPASSSKNERFNKRFNDKQRQSNKPRENHDKSFNQDEGNALTKSTHHDPPKQESPKKPYASYNKPTNVPLKETETNIELEKNITNKEFDTGANIKKKDNATNEKTSTSNFVPKTSMPELTFKSEPIKPKGDVPIKEPSNTSIKPASVNDVTPTRKLLPKNYLIEKLAIGETVILSVEAVERPEDKKISGGDYVCLSMSEAFEQQYQSLCEDFVLDCDQDEQVIKIIPGETVAYFNPEDGGWYRARVLNMSEIALLDAGKIIKITSTDKIRKLPVKYSTIPEFCCVLQNKGVEVGANLSCKILSQTPKGYKISMTDVDTGASMGEGELSRWTPVVQYPQPTTTTAIPEVERPPVTDGSRVLLVLATSLDRVFIRPADDDSQRKYNDILQQVLLTAINSKPLTEPPQKGQMVIGKFTDGNFYRALVKRTNVKQNKYQIEYVEYGNIEVSTLENLYPCPSEVDVSTIPAQVSLVKLGTATTELSPPALAFIEEISAVGKEEELILTLPEGRKSALSGSEATLTVEKNRVNINKKLIEMCTPDWKKFEEKGGDVVETEHIMFDDMEYTVLPASGCVLEVLDISVLRGAVISGYDRADTRASAVFNQLTAKMADYCNSGLGREPYLPKPEELCIAQLPPYPQWFRAVFLEQISGPGGSEGRVCYLDYGNIANVPVTLLRKMMPEFITGYPVMGLHIEIRGFSTDATDVMLARAVEHMKIDDEGRGVLKVSNCVKLSDGMYAADAPELLAAMKL